MSFFSNNTLKNGLSSATSGADCIADLSKIPFQTVINYKQFICTTADVTSQNWQVPLVCCQSSFAETEWKTN